MRQNYYWRFLSEKGAFEEKNELSHISKWTGKSRKGYATNCDWFKAAPDSDSVLRDNSPK